MEFGKVADISSIQFCLPPIDSKTKENLSIFRSKAEPKIYIGNPSWGCKKWIGKIYPPKTHSKDFFSHYVQQYSAIELNTTFYQIPTLQVIERWKSIARDRKTSPFKFCPKVFRGISHQPDLAVNSTSKKIIYEFIDAVLSFEETLGLCFLQIPSEAELKSTAYSLKNFIELLPPNFPLAVELRHPSWFEGSKLRFKLVDFLSSKNISTVITDVAGRRDVLHSSVTTPSVMVRFIGNNLHPTDYTRIDEWTLLLKKWIEIGIQQIYFMPHQPDDILAPELASYLISKLNSSQMGIAHSALEFCKIEPKRIQKSLF